MKIVFFNKKDVEKEKKIIEAGRYAMLYQSKLIYKNALKRIAKLQAQQELANEETGSDSPAPNNNHLIY